MKKISKSISFSLFLALFCIVICLSASAFTVEEVSYEIKNNEVYITAVNGEVPTDVVILDTVEYLPVVGIKSGVFQNCVQIKTVTLPTTLKIIDENAFAGCTEIETIYFKGTEDAWVEGIYKFPETTTKITVHYNSKNHEHIWQEEITPALCGSDGYTKNYCECGEYYYSDYLEATSEHAYTTTVTPATTTADGVIATACKYCDYYECETITKVTTIKLSTSECTYNGKVRTPSITVKDEKDKTLILDTDYTVTIPDGRKLPGIYEYKITFIGNYEGETTLNFIILPKAPKKITATQSTKAIKLTWSESVGATGYRVYQCSPSKGKFVKIASVKGVTSYRKAKNIKAGTEYKFIIKPYTKLSDGTVLWGADSEVFATATEPAAPTKISATQSVSVIKLSWGATTGSTGYRVYQYSPSKGKYVQIASVKATSYRKDKNLKAGTSYKFKIKPYIKLADGTVIWGSASSVFKTATEPEKVKKFYCVAPQHGYATQVKMKWSKVSGASGYKIYMYNPEKKAYEYIEKVVGRTYTTVDNLIPETNYKFKIKAYRTVGGVDIEGVASDVASYKTPIISLYENYDFLLKHIIENGQTNANGDYYISRTDKNSNGYYEWAIIYDDYAEMLDLIVTFVPNKEGTVCEQLQMKVDISNGDRYLTAVSFVPQGDNLYVTAVAKEIVSVRTYTTSTNLDFEFERGSDPDLMTTANEKHYKRLFDKSLAVWDDMIKDITGYGINRICFLSYK